MEDDMFANIDPIANRRLEDIKTLTYLRELEREVAELRDKNEGLEYMLGDALTRCDELSRELHNKD